MHLSKLLLCCLATIGLSSAPACLNAQIVVRTYDVSSTTYGVKSRFVFTVDPATNKLKVEIDNTIAGKNGFTGTITSFGFNTPFTNEQLGGSGSNVTFTQRLNGILVSGDNKWTKFDPYGISQNGGMYSQDFGVGAGNVPEGGNANKGIKFGDTAKFVFNFPDFSSATGFFNSAHNLSVRWQEVENNACNNFSDVGWSIEECPPVPEPSTYGLIGAGALVGLALWRRRVGSGKLRKSESVV